jgi:hypothetical protein
MTRKVSAVHVIYLAVWMATLPRADACSEKIANYDAVISWMDNYCKAHPLDTIADAAGELVRALEEKAAKRSE